MACATSNGADFVYAPTALEALVEENPVRSFLSDSSGRTWIGTQSGLYRLDDSLGKPVSSVSNGMERMIPDEIVSLLENADGRVFALAESGHLYVYSLTDEKFKSIATSRKKLRRRGRLLVLTEDGALAVQMEKSIELYRHVSSENSEAIEPKALAIELQTQVVSTKEHGLCGGTSNHILCGLTEDSDSQTAVFSARAGTQILELVYLRPTDELLILLSDYSAIVQSVPGLSATRELNFGWLRDSKLRAIEHLNGQLFFGTDRGLFSADLKTAHRQRLQTSKYSAVTGMTVSPHGLWFFSENGMGYLAASKGGVWQGSNPKEGLEVLGFSENGQEGVFIATYDGIVYWNRALDSHKNVWPPTNKERIDTRVTALSVFDDRLMAGSFDDGLRIFQISTNGNLTATHLKLLPDTGITVIEPAFQGTLIGTDTEGLKLLRNDRLIDVKLPLDWRKNPSPITSITSLDDDNRVLVTTEDHLVLICIGEEKPHSCGLQASNSDSFQPKLLSSEFGYDGTIWLGTLNHGLLKSSIQELENRKPLTNSPSYGTGSLSIYGAVKEGPETLWVATNNGLLAIDTNSGTARHLGRIHGLANMDFNHGASLRTQQELIFGGHFGYDKVSLNRPAHKGVASYLWLSGIAIDGELYRNYESQLLTRGVVLPSGHSKTGFHLTVNDYRMPSLNQYKHKLEGYETIWQNTGSLNVATYQNLPPGNYTFKARGANSAGIWSDNEISVPIKVLPPVWQTWWAYVGYLILALAAIRYLKVLNDRQVARKERLKIAEDGSAAFARLEDDYQAQREANEALLRQRTPSARQLLDVVEAALTAQIKEADESSLPPLSRKIAALRSLQTFTDRTFSQELTDLHALTNEVTAQFADSHELAARAIITNDVCKDRIPFDHAIYLCLVIQEALEITINHRLYSDSVDPMIYIAMAKPVHSDAGEPRYEVYVEDSGLKHDGSVIDTSMPLTLHLADTHGGEVLEDYDAGNTLTIRLQFPSPNPDL